MNADFSVHSSCINVRLKGHAEPCVCRLLELIHLRNPYLVLVVLEAVTSSLLIFIAVRRDCHPADNTWAKTFHHILHWCGGLHLFQLLQQRTHGPNHHTASSTLRAASPADPHRDLQERLFPVERASVTQRHCHQVGAATQLNTSTSAMGGSRTIFLDVGWNCRTKSTGRLWQPCCSFPALVGKSCVA